MKLRIGRFLTAAMIVVLPAAADGPVDGSPLIPSDREAGSLLRRVRTAGEAGRWEEGVRLLQDLLDGPSRDRMVEVGSGIFRSGAEGAREALAAWPPEGLAAYRRIQEPRAERVLAESGASRTRIDFCRRFPFTAAAERVRAFAAAEAIERGAVIEARAWLRDAPEEDTPPWSGLRVRLATIEGRAEGLPPPRWRFGTDGSAPLPFHRETGEDPLPVLPGIPRWTADGAGIGAVPVGPSAFHDRGLPLPRLRSLLADGERIYAVGIDRIEAYRVGDGRFLWGSRRLKTERVFPATPPGATLKGDLLFACAGGELAAFERETGRAVWALPRAGEGLSGWRFASVPAVFGGTVHALAYRSKPHGDVEIAAFAVGAADGRVRWRRVLGGTFGTLPFRDGLLLPAPVEREGRLLVATGAGSIACLDPIDGHLLWLRSYPARSPQEQRDARRAGAGWSLPALEPAGDTLLLAPADADRLFGIDPEDGGIRWSRERGNARHLAVAGGGGALLYGGTDVIRLHTDHGEPIARVDLPAPVLGRGFVAGNALVLPTADGAVRLGVEAFAPIETIAWDHAWTGAVDLVPVSDGKGIVAGDWNGIVAYGTADGASDGDAPAVERGIFLSRAGRDREAAALLAPLAEMEGLAGRRARPWLARIRRAEALAAADAGDIDRFLAAAAAAVDLLRDPTDRLAWRVEAAARAEPLGAPADRSIELWGAVLAEEAGIPVPVGPVALAVPSRELARDRIDRTEGGESARAARERAALDLLREAETRFDSALHRYPDTDAVVDAAFPREERLRREGNDDAAGGIRAYLSAEASRRGDAGLLLRVARRCADAGDPSRSAYLLDRFPAGAVRPEGFDEEIRALRDRIGDPQELVTPLVPESCLPVGDLPGGPGRLLRPEGRADGGLLLSGDGRLAEVDLETGRFGWVRDVGEGPVGAMAGTDLWVWNDWQLMGLEPATGAPRWRLDLPAGDRAAAGPPAPERAGGGATMRLIPEIFAADPRPGGTRIHRVLDAGDDLRVVLADGGRLLAFRGSPPHFLWSRRLGDDARGGSVSFWNGALLAADTDRNRIRMLDPVDASVRAEVPWEERIDGFLHAGPDRLLVWGPDGVDGLGPELQPAWRWRTQLGWVRFADLSVTGDRVALHDTGTDDVDRIHVLGTADGRPLATIPLAEGEVLEGMRLEDRLELLTLRGDVPVLRSFDPTDGRLVWERVLSLTGTRFGWLATPRFLMVHPLRNPYGERAHVVWIDRRSGTLVGTDPLPGHRVEGVARVGSRIAVATERLLLVYGPALGHSWRDVLDRSGSAAVGDPDRLYAMARSCLALGATESAAALAESAVESAPLERTPTFRELRDALRELRDLAAPPEALAVYREVPPEIDGVLDGDWSEPYRVDLDRARFVRAVDRFDRPADGWGGPEDLSGRLYLGWDEDYLYVALEVVDDAAVTFDAREGYDRGDSLWIAIDGLDNGGFRLGLRDDRIVGLAVQNPPVNPPDPEELPPGDYAAQRREGDRGTVYEGAIPWAFLRGRPPAPGETVGLTLISADDDGEGVRQVLEWTAGFPVERLRGEFGDPEEFAPALFGTVRMLPPEGRR